MSQPVYYDDPLVCSAANGWIISEDFISISGVGSTGWTVAPTGASAGVFAVVPPAGDLIHPGVVRVATGTTATGRVALSRGASRMRLPAGVPLGRLTVEALVRVPTLPTALENYLAFVGLADSTVLATGAAEIGWRLDLSGAWTAILRIGGVDLVSVPVPAVAGQWTRLRLDYSSDAGAVWSVASPSPGDATPRATALPAVVDPLASATLTPAVKVFKSAGAANREIEVDYIYLSQYAPGVR